MDIQTFNGRDIQVNTLAVLATTIMKMNNIVITKIVDKNMVIPVNSRLNHANQKHTMMKKPKSGYRATRRRRSATAPIPAGTSRSQ